MEDSFRDKFALIIELFKDRPYHFSQFLIDNLAFNKNFINKVLKSDINNKNINSYVTNISDMKDIFNLLLESSKEQISEVDLNNKLLDLLSNERYEEAAKLRDLIIKKRKK